MCHDEKNLNTKSCEYRAVYLDELYIASPRPEDIVNTLKKYKIKSMQIMI